MARLLALSSQVAAGHVGLSAAQPALTALGHTVTALPTVILSNHPGFPQAAGMPIPPETLSAMIDAVEANGWLAGHDAVLTGYLPSPQHVDLAADLIDRARAARPGIRVVADPVLGDEPKGIYIDAEAAAAIRDHLVPRADILTPNRFELGWLTGAPVATIDDMAAAAAPLAPRVLVTSAAETQDVTGVLDVAGNRIRHRKVPHLDGVPHGVGDVFAALIAAGYDPGQALDHLQALIRESAGRPHLRIIETAGIWTAPAPPA
ncbi:MAG: PfkB family carbohydrate kinase [Marinibacterium sp.]